MNHSVFYLIPCALAAYYGGVWLLVGSRSTDKSTMIEYRPPDGFSPAAIRYVVNMACDGRIFVAILAQLAAQRLLAIIPEKPKHKVQLVKLPENHGMQLLADEERLVLKHIFEWEDQVELTVPDSNLLQKIDRSLRMRLSKYISRNIGYVCLGLVMTGCATVCMCLSLRLFGDDPIQSRMVSSFTGLTVAMCAATGAYFCDSNLVAVKLALRGVYHRRILFFLLFVILLFPIMWYVLIRTVAPVFANVTGLLIVINMVFPPLLRAYTAAGRQLYSRIQGFRQFLQQVEQDRLQRLNLPGQTLEADHEHVPYAIALDLREAWGDDLGIKTLVETQL